MSRTLRYSMTSPFRTPVGVWQRLDWQSKSQMRPTRSQGSTLTMLALGDGRSANEPQQLGTYSIPRSRQVIEGAHANARHRQELLLDIWDKCNSAGGISTSPIFLGVKQSIASLRSKGCKESSHCQLLVSSDLEENVEPAIKERLNHRNSKRELPTRLDNRGIGVVFCGFAATAGVIEDASGREIRKATPRNPGREDRIAGDLAFALHEPGGRSVRTLLSQTEQSGPVRIFR